MRNTIESCARSWRLGLLGALTVLAVVLPALPAGAGPTLLYSTFLGGSRYDEGFAVAAQGGNTFIAGDTYSLDYPVVAVSSGKPRGETIRDVFVTALGPSGIPFYSTYIPISGYDSEDVSHVLAIAAGPDGSAYVTVITYLRGMAETAFDIVKLAPSGEVAWTTYASGRLNLAAMTVDSQGNVYITGSDHGENPYWYQKAYRDEAFAWKINADGSHGYWSGIDGEGDGDETGEDIAVDAAGNAYVLGTTNSLKLPKAIQPAPEDGWGNDAFVTKLGPTGSILWSTYLGGSGHDSGGEIGVATDSSLVVVGTTTSPDFPTLNALQTELRGPVDLFLARLKPWGQRISSTYLGGSGGEQVLDLALESSTIVLAVSSPGPDSPLRAPLDPACGSTYFAARLDATASQVLDAGCLGGSYIYAVAADASGISVTGGAPAGLQPVNAWQPSPAGSADAFATKLVLNHPPDCSAATASPAALWPADWRFVSVSIRGITDREGDRVTLALTSVFQDEGLTKPGTPDATGLGTSTARLRADRLNGGNGRVYHLGFTATDARGGACTGTVKVCVPPAQGGTCVDGGARVNSTMQ